MELARVIDSRDLDDPEISALKDQLLSLIASRGLVENEELVRMLGWDAESCGYIGRLLIQAGMLRAGKRGEELKPGGSDAWQAESKSEAVLTRRSEKSLYSPIIETLRSAWVAEHEIQDFVMDLTASQGGRATGGKWSRPDITLACSNEYKYVPGRFVELRTFEVSA
jgi:hypothetical protein